MQTVSSKEVSEMFGKRHDNFMRDIRKYISTLGDEAHKYFIEGSYKDGIGKTRSGYEITLAGCGLIAGRMIGEKGTAFKQKYLQIFYPEEVGEKDYSVKEVAKILGISERTVYRNIESGKIATIQKEVVSTVIAVTESALNAYKVERGME